MRNTVMVPVLALLSFLMLNCTGENGEYGAGDTDVEAARQEIKNVIDATWNALEAQDLAAFQQHTSSDWHLYTERANKMTAENLVNTHKKNLTDFNVDYSNLQIHVNGPMAWATYDATLSGLWHGEKWGGEFIFTNIFERRNGEWTMVHMHEAERETPRSGAETSQ